MITFEGFPKVSRLTREMIITEKIDGTSAQVIVDEDGNVGAASRTRLITPADDNYGFAKWVDANKDELREKLGIGRHFGEWWGAGIRRKYGQTTKRFSLFNVSLWEDPTVRPVCCDVVPVLYRGPFDTQVIDEILRLLPVGGSIAAPGFMKPEGVVVYHVAGGVLFKKTIERDEEPKGRQESA
jgi:hypothetical protein